MKKLMMGLLSFAMVFCLVACDGGSKSSIDLSKYPKDFAEWKTQDVINYLHDKGVFTNKDFEYVQTKDDKYNPTPKEMTELGSYMDDAGLATIFIYYFDQNTKSDVVKSTYEIAKKNKKFDIDVGGNEKQPFNVSHMIGQFGFDNSLTTDQELNTKFETALDDLCKDMNVTKDY